jgi:GAF domain-containing protein
MRTWLRRILAAPVFEDDSDKTRVARLLNFLLLISLAVILVTGLLAPLVFAQPGIALAVTGLVFVLVLISLVLMRLGRVRFASTLTVAGLWVAFTGLMLFSGGVKSPFILWYVTSAVAAGLLLGGRAAVAVVELTMLTSLGMFVAENAGLLPQPVLILEPGPAWINLTAGLVATVAVLYLASQSLSEALGRAHRSADELEVQRENLEEMVVERTRDLERRAVQLAAAAEVGRTAASILELEALVRQMVALVRERFDLYYVGLFLLDDAGEYAVLVAGTGEAGRIMRSRGYKLVVGGVSMVGAACAEGQPRIAQDVDVEPVRFDNPLLPLTRSEMALPLVVAERVLGALDVQSAAPAAFSEEHIAVLQLVADQVAVAVDNARKFSAEAELLEATSPLYRVSRRLVSAFAMDEIVQAILTSVAETEADGCLVGLINRSPDGEVESITPLAHWNRYGAVQVEGSKTHPASSSPLPLQLISGFWASEDVTREIRAPEDFRSFVEGYGGRAFVNVPLQVGARVIGHVSIYQAEAGPFSSVALRLYETLADQAAVALERARLLEESQRRAARERLIAELSGRMRERLEVETVLKTAVEGIGEALGLAALEVRLGTESAPGDDGNSAAGTAGRR